MLKLKYLLDFGSNFFIYFISALVGIVVARLAGPDTIGTLAYGLSFVQMFYFVFGLFGQSHVKLISEGKNIEDCKKVYSIIIGVTAMIFIVIVSLNYYIQIRYFDKSFTKTELYVILLSLLLVTIKGLFKVPEITFTALTQQAKINVPKIIKAIVYNLARLFVVLIGLKAIALASVNLLSFVVIIPIYLRFMGKGFFVGNWNFDLFKKYTRIGVPFLLITISLSLMEHYGNILLKDLSSTRQLGFFTGATSLAAMLIMVGGTAGSLFFPLFSKAHAEKNISLITSQIKKYEHFIFVFILPIVITFSVGGYTIITFLLGQEYLPSSIIFSVLILYSFFKIWTIPYFNFFNGVNKYNLNAVLHVCYTLLFFVILYFFVHKDFLDLGGLGLAASYLIVEIVKIISMIFIGGRTMDFDGEMWMWKYLLYYSGIFVVGYLLYNNYIKELNYFFQITYLAIYIIIIFLLSYVLKLMSRDDIRFVVEILNYKPLLKYIKKELKD